MNYTNNNYKQQVKDHSALDLAVANAYGKELADKGYLVLASHLPGFRQTCRDKVYYRTTYLPL